MKILLLISLTISFLSCEPQKRTALNGEILLGFLSLVPSEFYFTFPGRDSPAESKNFAKKKLISLLNSAKTDIEGYIYSLDDMEILIALRSAKNRGVKVKIQGDREEDYSEAEKYNLIVDKWRGSGIHHTKIWIVDHSRSFWGTGNFSSQGMTRDNNVFWEMSLKPQDYSSLMSILQEEEDFGIFNFEDLKILFAPQAGRLIQDQILRSIKEAKQNIRYMIFTHFDPLITYELLNACKRGVKVEGIYNQPVNLEGKVLSRFAVYPCRIYSDGNTDTEYRNGSYYGGLLHHKTMIIDDEIILVGAYNYTVSARDDNREFFFTFKSNVKVKEFMGEWKRVLAVAKEMDSTGGNDPEDPFGEYTISDLGFNSLKSTLMGVNRKGKWQFDKNSSGLAKEFEQSFDLLNQVPGLSLNLKIPERYYQNQVVLPNSLNWINERLVSVNDWYVVNLWNSVRIQTSDKLKIDSISIWDGKKPPQKYSKIGENEFDIGMLTKIKSEAWVIFETNKGRVHGCTKKISNTSSKWIIYLQQNQILSGLPEAKCKSF